MNLGKVLIYLWIYLSCKWSIFQGYWPVKAVKAVKAPEELWPWLGPIQEALSAPATTPPFPPSDFHTPDLTRGTPVEVATGGSWCPGALTMPTLGDPSEHKFYFLVSPPALFPALNLPSTLILTMINSRQKMLYASTKATFKKEFGQGQIKHELYANSLQEVFPHLCSNCITKFFSHLNFKLKHVQSLRFHCVATRNSSSPRQLQHLWVERRRRGRRSCRLR